MCSTCFAIDMVLGYVKGEEMFNIAAFMTVVSVSSVILSRDVIVDIIM